MHILSKKADGVLRLQIDRPAKKNALTLAMYDEQADAFETAETDRDVQVILVQGAVGRPWWWSGMPPINRKDRPADRLAGRVRQMDRPLMDPPQGDGAPRALQLNAEEPVVAGAVERPIEIRGSRQRRRGDE